MTISFMLQHIQTAQLDRERLDRAMMNEQLRIARSTRPSLALRLRTTIGAALISLGQRLSPTPGTPAASASREMTSTHPA